MFSCGQVPTLGAVAGARIVCYSNKKGKAKPKKKAEPGERKVEQQDAAEAPRIIDTSQYSLKAQLRFLRNVKRAGGGQGFGGTPQQTQRSSFRQKRSRAEDQSAGITAPGANTARNSKVSELAKEETLLSKGKGLSSLYNTQALANPPAVLVDGYNVLMKWLQQPGDLVRKNTVRGDLQASRLEVLRDLSDYSGWRKLRIMCAFDAQGNPHAPPLHRDQYGGVEVVYVGSGEADSFIISEAQQLRKSGCPYVLVASSDNDIRDACWTNEIFPISNSQLLREIGKAKKEADDYYKQKQHGLQRDRLGASLLRSNPALYEKLERARLQGMRGLL